MDKLLSVVTALCFVAFFLGVGWFFSGAFEFGGDTDHGFPLRERSLAGGVALLGGALGFWGGIALLVAIGLVTYGLQEILNYWCGVAMVKSAQRAGRPNEEIAAKIDCAPVSRGLKRKLKKWLERRGEERRRDAGTQATARGPAKPI